MTASECNEVIIEIEQFYEKEYNKEQRRYIYEEFKNISKARFRQVIRQVFKTCKFMPKLADLLDIERELPKEQVQPKEKAYCKRCKSTGLIPYTRLVNTGSRNVEYMFTARCNCANAIDISKEIPLADEIGV